MTTDYEKEAKNRKKSNNMRPLRRLLPMLGQYRWKVLAALISLLVAALATLAIPLAVRRVLDHGFTTGNAALVNQYFAMMLAVVFALAAASATRFYFVSWLGERVVADVRDKLFRHLTHLSPSFYETQLTGEVLSRLTADTTQIKSAFSSTASIALRNAVMLVGALAMMVYTSPRLSGFAALAIPAVVLPLIFYGRRVRKLSRAAQDALAGSAAFAQEHLGAITTVQANNQEERINGIFSNVTQRAFAAAAQRTTARAILTFAIILVATGAIVGLLWLGANSVISGKMSGGTLSQFVLYAVFAASSLGQLSEVWGEIQLAAGAAERISELLDEKPAIDSPAQPLPLPAPVAGHVSFDAVSFQYPLRPGQLVLNAISFTAEPGEVVAIVGPSGAGKTTLFHLLQRLYDPTSGMVSLDGTDIRKISLGDLRNALASVPQDPVIFSASLADNIRFGSPGASEEAVRRAALDARVDAFARELPQGYDTLLGERGTTLSGGQRQRVAIARAILRDSPVLLLDEATSALDAESESLIQEALQHVSKNRTTLVIAHRLATVRQASKIIVLDKGRIAAMGTHSQLMKSSPLYTRLAKLQFSAPST